MGPNLRGVALTFIFFTRSVVNLFNYFHISCRLLLPVTVTCKLSLRISELVPVREDGTMLRESSERHTTNPAMQFTICCSLCFIFL